MHKTFGGDTAGTADPNWPKGYPTPYDFMLSVESWGRNKKGGGGTFGVMPFAFPSNCPVRWSPASLEVAEHRHAHGK